MGWARIVSGGPDGRYVIEMDYGEATRVAALAALSAQRAEFEIKLVAAQEAVDEATAKELQQVQLMSVLQDEYVDAFAAGTPLGDNSAWEFQQVFLLQMRAKHAPLRLLLAAIKFDLLAVNKEIAKWTTFSAIEQRPAWCTTLTEDMAPDTYRATVEIPGESNLILLAPEGRAAQPSDGQLRAREIMSPWQAFFNAAILPGWQKDKPTYRWGTITELDGAADTATVALAEALSSAQRLNVNQSATLSNVPVVYMTCNAAAFEVGDRVIVEFYGQDWTTPRVIGFLDNPRTCNWVMVGGVGISVGRLSPVFVAFSANVYEAFVSATVEGRVDGGDWTALTNDFPGGDSESFRTHNIGSYEALPGIFVDFGLAITIAKPIRFASQFPTTPQIDGATAYAYFNTAGPTGNYGIRPLSKFEIRARAPDQTLLLNLATLEIGWADEFIPPTGKSPGGFRQRAGYANASVLDYQLSGD